MSIYSSHAAPNDDHPVHCAVYVEDPPGSGCYEFSGQPCDCGLRGAPIIYEGSHVLPSDDDPRGGSVDIASINGEITRDGRDNPGQYDIPHPWLRLGVDAPGGSATVVLDRRQVEQIRDELTAWLEAVPARVEGER